MSALAYGLVECCSGIASYETSSIRDKCSSLCNSMQLYFLHCNCLMECDEDVAGLNRCIVPLNNCNCKHLCMFSLNVF